MFPLRADVPARGVPLVVALLAAASAAGFGLEVLAATRGGEAALDELVRRHGLVPRELLRGLASPGAGAAGSWLTPLSAMFLHAGPLHLLGNLLYLWVFGGAVEDLLGHRRFAVFYLACGLAAAAAHVASDPSSWQPALGASGAVSGVLGAYALAYPGGWLRLAWPPLRVPAAVFFAAWIALQLGSGLSEGGDDGVAWWAHLGGFAAGVALGRAMRVRKPTRSRLRI